jgi:hypothetical protein
METQYSSPSRNRLVRERQEHRGAGEIDSQHPFSRVSALEAFHYSLAVDEDRRKC